MTDKLREHRIKVVSALLQHQADLNFNSYGNDWFSKAQRREWSYPTAIGDELQEYIRSIWTPWWSKENTVDMTNAQIELVDVLHFLLSELMAAHGGIQESPNIVATANTVVDAFEDAYNVLDSTRLFSLVDAEDYFTRQLDVTISGIASCQDMAYELNDYDKLVGFLIIFIAAAVFTFDKDLSFTKFINLYYAKGVLNKFRQDNGYRAKKYKKIWDDQGNEDNYYLTKYVASQLGAMDQNHIYMWLKDRYNNGNPVQKGV